MKFHSPYSRFAVALIFVFTGFLIGCSSEKNVGSTGANPTVTPEPVPPKEEKPTPTTLPAPPPPQTQPPSQPPPSEGHQTPPTRSSGNRLLCQTSVLNGVAELETMRSDADNLFMPTSIFLTNEKNQTIDSIDSFQIISSHNSEMELLFSAYSYEKRQTSVYQARFDLMNRKVSWLENVGQAASIDSTIAPPLHELSGHADFAAISRESSLLLTSNLEGNAYILRPLHQGSILFTLKISPKEYFNPQLSADGKWASFQKIGGGSYLNFVYSFGSQKLTAIPTDGAQEIEYPVHFFGNNLLAWVHHTEKKGLVLKALRLSDLSKGKVKVLTSLSDKDLQTFGLTFQDGALRLNKVFETFETLENSSNQRAIKTGYFEIHSWAPDSLTEASVEKVNYPAELLNRRLLSYESVIHSVLYGPWAQEWIATTRQGIATYNLDSKSWSADVQPNSFECFNPSVGPDVQTGDIQ